MTAATATNNPFTAIHHEVARIKKVNGKPFTMDKVFTYSLIKSFQDNGQVAYFSHAYLEDYLSCSRTKVKTLLNEMVAMGLINKTEQVNGGTLNYTVNPITPEMLGTVEKEQPTDAPQRAATVPEEVQELNHTAEAVEAPEIKPMTAAAAPRSTAPITLVDVYSKKVQTVDQTDPQAGVAVPVVTLYPREKIEGPSSYDFGEPF